MTRFALLLLLSATRAGADAVDIDAAAQVYQDAAVREQLRATLGSMPGRMRQMFAADPQVKLSDKQIEAVTAAAQRGFRIDVFEAPALAALAANLDPATVKKSIAFLSTDLGRRMVADDVALARVDEATIDKIMGGELAAPSTPRRDALMADLERAAQSTESAVQIYLSLSRALAIGTAIGSGLDPIAADERARKAADVPGRKALEDGMRQPLRRYMSYDYRDLSDADVKRLLAFLETKEGKRYVTAYIAAMGAGFDAMGRRCGEQIGESWRELAQAQTLGSESTSGGPLPAPPTNGSAPTP